MKTELEKFYAMIEDIEIAMMTTRQDDGHLRSRAMANQKQADGADLWFVTSKATAKLHDVEHDPHVNLTYYRERSGSGFPFRGPRRSLRTGRRSASSTSPTGKCGSRTKAIRVMAPRTIRDWC